MGVDVNLYAEGDVSDEELVAANNFMAERAWHLAWQDDGDRTLLKRSGPVFENRVEVNTGNRYYGPGYERGDWPIIYGAIRALQAALPHCKVFYGGDTTDDGIEATDDYLAEIWDHWCGPDGLAYSAR